MNTQRKSHPSLSRSLQTVLSILDFDLVQKIRERLAEQKAVSVVDIGCGVGRSLWELASIFSQNGVHLKLCGIFYSEKPDPKSIFFANQKRHEDVLKNPLLIPEEFGILSSTLRAPKLLNTDACKPLPIDTGSVDFIYSTNAFHYFEDKIAALTEISRILKINGTAVLTIDRTDDGFWPSDLCFPRLKMYRNSHIINGKEFLERASNSSFTVSVKKIDSYGTGENSYVLLLHKHSENILAFPKLRLQEDRSFSLEAIRCSNEDLEKIDEYQRLIADGATFMLKARKEHFGGYVSSYEVMA